MYLWYIKKLVRVGKHIRHLCTQWATVFTFSDTLNGASCAMGFTLLSLLFLAFFDHGDCYADSCLTAIDLRHNLIAPVSTN